MLRGPERCGTGSVSLRDPKRCGVMGQPIGWKVPRDSARYSSDKIDMQRYNLEASLVKTTILTNCRLNLS